MHAPADIVTERTSDEIAEQHGEALGSTVWIVEDEAAAADLAAELCAAVGIPSTVFSAAQPFLWALRDGGEPRMVILDWRLEHELSAALFMATRHRFPVVPVIYWTGSPLVALPSMIRDDPLTRFVDKGDGTAAFEEALEWAVERTGGR